jgi:acetylornithine deacetylase/succinyl-diaminopimelate desuccinylase-like protein
MKVKLEHASHSGMFGGAVPDAMLATIKLLATLWDDDGVVAVAGVTERDAETPDYTEETLRDEAGLPAGVSPIGRGSILSRIWNKPSITVTGIDAPSVKNASNTLSPEVSVVISMRVAPGQDARAAYAALEAHLRAHAPFGPSSFSDIDCGDASSSTRAGSAVAPRATRSRRATASRRSTSASADRSRSSPTSCASSPALRSW